MSTDLKRLWQEFQAMPFPRGLGDEVINGVDLRLLDTETAGCVASAVGGCRFNPDQGRILSGCISDLDSVMPELTEYAREYFDHLGTMAKLAEETKLT